ncbi:VOC family protein [Algoriphagus lacus]|nr:hypothetical protein [Algoriphagus lacus]
MKQSIDLLLEDYDEAIRSFTQILDFKLLQNIHKPEQNERWVTVSPQN